MDVLSQNPRGGVRVCLILVFLLGTLAVDGEGAQQVGQWPSFRGPHASGAADGHELPSSWDIDTGEQVAWRVAIPGLAHSSPIVWDGRIYLTTAVAAGGEVDLVTGDVDAAGIDPAADLGPHAWHLIAIALADGEIIWDTVAYRGDPRLARHAKASHASATPATNGERIVALFGTEGLFCFDMQGELQWRTDLSLLDVGLWGDPESQWGAASSPVIWQDRVFVQNDRHESSFVAAYDLQTGAELWRAARDEKPAWSTPTLLDGESPQLITNGANWIRGYDPLSGEELWRLSHGDLQVIVPTPVVSDDRVFITGGYPAGGQPIYALRPPAAHAIAGRGDAGETAANETTVDLLWEAERGSPYTSTPLVYRDILYTITDSGILSAHDVQSGERLYRQRLAVGAGFSASPVASDGRIFLASEDGDVFVVRAGSEFEILAQNTMLEVLMATPAIASGTLVIRGRSHLSGIRAQ
jgi:outer membrane protein assembly factor BamB